MGKVHKTYLKNSPFYRQLFDKFGAVLTREQAQAIADAHGLSLVDDLDYASNETRFATLELIQRLGY